MRPSDADVTPLKPWLIRRFGAGRRTKPPGRLAVCPTAGAVGCYAVALWAERVSGRIAPPTVAVFVWFLCVLVYEVWARRRHRGHGGDG